MNFMKKRIFSGIKATGELHLGNYIGAIRNWIPLCEEYDCLFSIVDLHSITTRQDPAVLRERSFENLALYIAAGLDPDKNLLFFQSHVRAHAECSWILGCYTQMGELLRMTQYKDALAKEKPVTGGFFTYPVLMAADILVYDAAYVPVGEDQKQHLELARDIAIRFNGIYGDTFVVPEPFIPKVGARIMDLQSPTNKMSKSSQDEGENYGCILLLDDDATILKKCKRAVTDSDNKICCAEGKDGINNLLGIYAALRGIGMDDTVAAFEGKGYGAFKAAVAEAVIDTIRPIREKYRELRANPDYVRDVYTRSAEKAAAMADPKIQQLYDIVGFVGK